MYLVEYIPTYTRGGHVHMQTPPSNARLMCRRNGISEAGILPRVSSLPFLIEVNVSCDSRRTREDQKYETALSFLVGERCVEESETETGVHFD